MHIRILAQYLQKVLGHVGRIVASRPTLPVLENILLEASEDGIRLVSTNLDISLNVWVDCDVLAPGAVTVPARLMTDFVALLPADRKIVLQYQDETRQLEVQCGSYQAAFHTVAAAEFPEIPTEIAGDGETVQLDLQGLRGMIERTVFAAAKTPERPNLAGVDFRFANDTLTMAATDGFRLSVCTAPTTASTPEVRALVPATALTELARLWGDADRSRPIRLATTTNGNQIHFALGGRGHDGGTFDRVLLICQLIDGTFPDYRRIIPEDAETQTRVHAQTDDLHQSVRAAFLFSRESHGTVSLTCAPRQTLHPDGEIAVSAESAQRGANTNQIPARVDGPALEIAFNGQYVIDFLQHVGAAELEIGLAAAGRPGVLRPVPQAEFDFLHVIMPMSPPRAGKG